jgi:hypothetical protein
MNGTLAIGFGANPAPAQWITNGLQEDMETLFWEIHV